MIIPLFGLSLAADGSVQLDISDCQTCQRNYGCPDVGASCLPAGLLPTCIPNAIPDKATD